MEGVSERRSPPAERARESGTARSRALAIARSAEAERAKVARRASEELRQERTGAQDPRRGANLDVLA